MNYPQSQDARNRVQTVFDAFTSNQPASHSSQVKWFFTFYLAEPYFFRYGDAVIIYSRVGIEESLDLFASDLYIYAYSYYF